MPAPTPPAELVRTRALERAVAQDLRAFVAALRDLPAGTAAACIEVAGGTAATTGAGSPLTTVKGIGPSLSGDELDEIEGFFRAHDVGTVTIEVAPWLDDEAHRLLAARGYRAEGTEAVVTATAPGPSGEVEDGISVVPVEEWPDLMLRTSELPDAPPFTDLAVAAAHHADVLLLGRRGDDGRWVACGQSVPYDDAVILGCDGTLPDERRRGAQGALIRARLATLPAGRLVMAEVEPGSGSERNYLRCGFEVAYTRTHLSRALG